MKKYLFIAVLILSGCSASNGPSSNDVIMPLALGNQWIGKVTIFDTAGNVAGTRYDTLRVYGTQTINGTVWYLRTTIPDPLYIASPEPFLIDSNHYLYANLAGGLFRRLAGATGGAVCAAKFPAQAGDTVWKLGGILDTSDGSITEDLVASTNEPVFVPAGVYNCYHYRLLWINHSKGTTDTFPLGNDWYSQGTGLVQYEYYVTDPSDTASTVFTVHRELWQLVRADLH